MRKKAIGIYVAMLLCLGVPLALLGNTAAEPVETNSIIGNLSENRVFAGVVEDAGKLYVIGGLLDNVWGWPPLDTVLIYDIASGETSYGTPMPSAVCILSASKGDDGRVYAFGGWNGGSYTGLVQIYDPELNSWSSGAAAPLLIGGGAAVTLSNGSIALIGAVAYGGFATLIYDPVGDSWSFAANQPSALWLRAAVVWNSTAVYALGGRDTMGNPVTDVDVFNPEADTWSTAAPLELQACLGVAAVGDNERIYYFGGVDGAWPDAGPAYQHAQRYDPASDSWDVVWSFMWPGRSAAGAAVVDAYGRVFIAGGYDGATTLASVVMILSADVVLDSLVISSPSNGSIVSGEVSIVVTLSNPDVGVAIIEIYVDGALHDSLLTNWPSYSVVSIWDTSGLPDGSAHTVLARAYLWDGGIAEDVVSMTVSSESVEQRVASIEAEIASLQAEVASLQTMIDELNGSVGDVQADVSSLQAQLTAAQNQLNALEDDLADLASVQGAQGDQLDALNATLANLQAQLDALEAQLDDVETTSTSGSTWGMVNLVLLIIVIVLLALMFVMSRKGEVPPPPST